MLDLEYVVFLFLWADPGQDTAGMGAVLEIEEKTGSEVLFAGFAPRIWIVPSHSRHSAASDAAPCCFTEARVLRLQMLPEKSIHQSWDRGFLVLERQMLGQSPGT